MTTTVDHLATAGTMRKVLGTDFQAAYRELARARRWQLRKDTPAHRAAVAVALTRIDAVLDTYLDVRGLVRRAVGATSLLP